MNVNGSDWCNVMKDHGLLTKATKDNSIRFAPALVINEQEVKEGAEIVKNSLKDLEALNNQLQ